MGKSLKGKELGTGIGQRKDGYYTVRFTGIHGTKYSKYFKTLKEARDYYAEESFRDEMSSQDMTMDCWFKCYINDVKGNTIRDSTRVSYEVRYETWIKPYLGDMLLSEIKKSHCQNILNQMAKAGATRGSIKNTRTDLSMIMINAMDYDIISKNPAANIKIPVTAKSNDRSALTMSEQKEYEKAIKGHVYENIFLFLLNTGLRVGEMSALQWDDVDFDKHIIHVRHSMRYDAKKDAKERFIMGDPKSESGKRIVPLNQIAYDILLKQKDAKPKSENVQFPNLVFYNSKGERPIIDNLLNIASYTVCKKIGMRQVSMHILRHTFATRCIEGGMKPKTLQTILGHSSITMTMDRYVNTTYDELCTEMSMIYGQAEQKACRV